MSAMIAVGRAVRDEVGGRKMEGARGPDCFKNGYRKTSRPNLNSKKIGMGRSAVV